MQDFRNLRVWHAAQQLSTGLDPLVERIARRRRGLADQIDRCANSISANIAEAAGRETKADKRRILTIAIGETTELESHFVRERNATLITPADCDAFTEAATRIRKMLNALRKSMGRIRLCRNP